MFNFLVLLLLILLGGCAPPVYAPEVQTPVDEPARAAVVPVEPSQPSVSPQTVSEPVSEEQPAEQLEIAISAPLPEAVEEVLEPQSPLAYFGDFPLAEHQRVDRLLDIYTGNGRRTFGRWLERAGRYIPKIQMIFASEGLPLDLAYLAMIESGFNTRAYSWAHAVGPWQFIESTGKMYDLQNDWWRDDRCDVEKSTRAAAKHLKYLHARFDGDWYLAVAAYNAGGGKVRQAIRESGSQDFWDLAKGKVLREETRNYLPKLLAALKIVKDLEKYGFADLDFEPPLEYETVSIPSSTDLEVVARLCEVDYAEIKELNPELKRWCTPPGVKDYQLKVPFGTAEEFQRLYAELPAEERASYHRHQIKPGDTLGRLAQKYHIQIDDIIALNKISNPRALKVGSNLILPLKEGFTRLPVDELADGYVRSRRRTYTVRHGDSLWKIAKRFGVTEKQLRVWNRLGWSNLIKPGQKLAVARPGRRQVARAERSVEPARKVIYKVQPGDTLWGIGRQFDVELEMIRLWNDLRQGHILKPGQQLTLMVSASQRS